MTLSTMRKYLFLILVLFASTAINVAAQEQNNPLLSKILDRIQQLQNEVTELRNQNELTQYNLKNLKKNLDAQLMRLKTQSYTTPTVSSQPAQVSPADILIKQHTNDLQKINQNINQINNRLDKLDNLVKTLQPETPAWEEQQPGIPLIPETPAWEEQQPGIPLIPETPTLEEQQPGIPLIPETPTLEEQQPGIPPIPETPTLEEQQPETPPIPETPTLEEQQQPETPPIPETPALEEQQPETPLITETPALEEQQPEPAQTEETTPEVKTRVSPIESIKLPNENEYAAYSRAMSALDRADYTRLRDNLIRFLQDYPDGDYTDDANYWVAEAYYAEGNLDLAESYFTQLIEKYSDSEKRESALLKIAYIRLRNEQWEAARNVLEILKNEGEDKQIRKLAIEQLEQLKSKGY